MKNIALFLLTVSVILFAENFAQSQTVIKTILPAGAGNKDERLAALLIMYYEVWEYETYQMYFVRFSLDWLSDGKDSYAKF